MKLKELLSLAATLSNVSSLTTEIQTRATLMSNTDENLRYSQAIININNDSEKNKLLCQPKSENIFEILLHCAQATTNAALWSDKLLAVGRSIKSQLFEASVAEQNTYEKLIDDAKKYVKEQKPARKIEAAPSKPMNDSKNITIKTLTAAKQQFQLPRLPNINEILAKQKQLTAKNIPSPAGDKKVIPSELATKQREITLKKETAAAPMPKPATNGAHELINKQLEMEKKKNLTLESEFKKSQEKIQQLELEMKEINLKLQQGKKVAIDFHNQLKEKTKKCYELESDIKQANDKAKEQAATLTQHLDEKELSVQEQYFLYVPEEDGNINTLELNKLLNQIYLKFADDIDFHRLKVQTLQLLPPDQKAMKDFVERLYEEYKEINHDILFTSTPAPADAKKNKLWQNPEAKKFIEMLDKDLKGRVDDVPPYGNESSRLANKKCAPFFTSVRKRIETLKDNSELIQLSKHRLSDFVKRNKMVILRRAADKYKERVLSKTSLFAVASTQPAAVDVNNSAETQSTLVGYITSTAYSWLRWGKDRN